MQRSISMMVALLRQDRMVRLQTTPLAAARGLSSAFFWPSRTAPPLPHAAAPPRRALCADAGGSGARGMEHVLEGKSDYIQVKRDEGVGVVELHRPSAMNALNAEMRRALVTVLQELDADPAVRAIVLTGGERAFAAGADIAEMAGRTFHAARYRHDAGRWIEDVTRVRTPLIAAVNGFALGGGCELALAADIVIAAEDAVFGQPEVQIGSIPGWGGTQRLVRAVGKAKAMEMILTGRQMTAEEAESAGLVSRVAKKGGALQEAKAVAQVIARHSAPIVQAAKECVNVAAETSLSEGIRFERRAFQSMFSLDDHDEGIRAFLDKRSPSWSHE
jgi:enoyl-CoA hydratase